MIGWTAATGCLVAGTWRNFRHLATPYKNSRMTSPNSFNVSVPRTPAIITFETSGQWAVALRAALAGTEIAVIETRSLKDCWGELASAPANLVALELPQLSQRYPVARAVVVGPRSLTHFAAIAAEAGAAWACFSPRQLAPIRQIAERHFAAVPNPPLDRIDRLIARLPWG